MSVRQYRLAIPISNTDHDNNRKQLNRITYNSETNTNKVLLVNEKTARRPSNLPSSTPRWWLVIPCLLLIILTTSSDTILMNDFIVRRYERRYGIDSSEQSQRTSCRQLSNSTPLYWYLQQYSPTASEYNMVQQDASKFNVKNSIATLVPSLFSIVLLGSNCDTIGRRPLLFLPFLGKVIRYVLMLIIIARDLSDTWLLLAHAFEASFGSVGLVMLSAFAYITDCTHESVRTRPFLLAEVATVAARIIGILAVGLWLKRYLYIVPTSVCLALSVIGVLYVLFIQAESVQSVRHKSLVRQLASIRLKPVIRCIHVFVVKRPGSNQQHLLLITIVNILLLFMLFGYTSIFPLFAYGRPFCLDALNVGLLASAQAIAVCLLTLIATVFKNQQLDNNYLLPIIGALALVGNLVLFGVVKQVWLLYIAACIGSVFFITLPVLRSKLSRLVQPSEYAIVFIAAAFIETVGDKAISAASNAIYNASIHFWSGLVFVVLAILGILPLGIMGCLAFTEKKTVVVTAADVIANV